MGKSKAATLRDAKAAEEFREGLEFLCHVWGVEIAIVAEHDDEPASMRVFGTRSVVSSLNLGDRFPT